MVTLANTPAEKLVVILIMPSSYDPEGYVNRYALGVLPSNSLVVMDTLTRAALQDMQSPSGQKLTTEVHMLEDGRRADAPISSRLRPDRQMAKLRRDLRHRRFSCERLHCYFA